MLGTYIPGWSSPYIAKYSHSVAHWIFPATGPALSATGHKAQKIRVTGYLMWYDDHNGSADFGSTIQYFGTNGFHHPWRSTAWEIHPIIKVGVVE